MATSRGEYGHHGALGISGTRLRPCSRGAGGGGEEAAGVALLPLNPHPTCCSRRGGPTCGVCLGWGGTGGGKQPRVFRSPTRSPPAGRCCGGGAVLGGAQRPPLAAGGGRDRPPPYNASPPSSSAGWFAKDPAERGRLQQPRLGASRPPLPSPAPPSAPGGAGGAAVTRARPYKVPAPAAAAAERGRTEPGDVPSPSSSPSPEPSPALPAMGPRCGARRR